MPGSRPSPPLPYRVFGYVDGSFGLAVAGRNSLSVLEATSRPWEAFDFKAPPRPAPPGPPGPGVALFHANPLEIPLHAYHWRRQRRLRDWNVCVPFWELPRVPVGWEPLLRAMDAILAPTRFVEAACARVVPAERVLHYPQAAFLPPLPPPDRARWGLPPGATAFVAPFDLHSDVERKNPWAALRAFGAAFPTDPDVRLVVKMRAGAPVPAYAAAAGELRAAAARDPRVLLVEEDLRYEEVLSLYAACDVIVSLHRSEGLGLHLLEAMSLGRPAVTIAWSGNADFTTPENSAVVPHRLVPVRSGHVAYRDQEGREGQVWAEPDEGAAAEALRRLHASPALRAALGARAAADMAARRAAVSSGRALDELEERLRRRRIPRGLLLEAEVSRIRAPLHLRNLKDRLRARLRRG